MALDSATLDSYADEIMAQPQWADADETARQRMVRQFAVETRGELEEPDHAALVQRMWGRTGPGWLGESANFVGRSVKEMAASIPAGGAAIALAASDALGLSDTGSGERLIGGVRNLTDQAAQRVKQFDPNDLQENRDQGLEFLKEDIDSRRYPAGVEAWLSGEKEESELDDESRSYVDVMTRGLSEAAVKADHGTEATQQQIDEYRRSSRGLRNTAAEGGVPARELLADYVATGDPSSWQAFQNRVTETDAEWETRLRTSLKRSEAEAVAEANPGVMSDLAMRGMEFQGSPIDLAFTALPLIKGAKALSAARGGQFGAAGRQLAESAAIEGAQEAGTEYLMDAEAGAGQIAEAGGMGVIGGGVMTGAGALAGSAMRGSPPEDAVSPPPETPPPDAGQEPVAPQPPVSPAPNPVARASAVTPPVVSAPVPLSEEELTALGTPDPAAEVVRSAVAASPTPAVAAAVVDTAALADHIASLYEARAPAPAISDDPITEPEAVEETPAEPAVEAAEALPVPPLPGAADVAPAESSATLTVPDAATAEPAAAENVYTSAERVYETPVSDTRRAAEVTPIEPETVTPDAPAEAPIPAEPAQEEAVPLDIKANELSAAIPAKAAKKPVQRKRKEVKPPSVVQETPASEPAAEYIAPEEPAPPLGEQLVVSLPEAARKAWTPERIEAVNRYDASGNEADLADLPAIQRKRAIRFRMDPSGDFSLPVDPAPPAVPMAPETVTAQLSARGLNAGENLGVVNDPALPWEGRITPEGRIELNAARLATPADADRVMNHEAAELARRDPSMAPDIEAMRAAIPAEEIASLEDALSERYDADAIPGEVAANLAQILNERFAELPAWKRLVQRVATWTKQKFGMNLNVADAQALAARIVARGVRMVKRGETGDPGFYESYSLPFAKGLKGAFEKFFGNNRRLVSETKVRTAFNATRAALEVPLLEGIVDNHVPGQPLEETITGMTEQQRNRLHDRIVELAGNRYAGTPQQATDYAEELRDHLRSIPELAGQSQDVASALQYTNLVKAAAHLSGVHGKTGAFSFIMGLDNDNIKFDMGSSIRTRSDLGRDLGSQAGVGARIRMLADMMVDGHTAAFRRLGFTDDMLKNFKDATASRIFTAQELESMFADVNISALGPDTLSAMATLQRMADAAAQAKVKADAVKAKEERENPAKEETEIETLKRLQRESRGTPRARAIAAALRLLDGTAGPQDLSRANQQELAGFRDRFRREGGKGLAKNFWQLMATTPRPGPGALQMFDNATQNLLSDLLRRAVEKAGLAGDTTSIQPTAIDKIVANLSDDALRWEKIEAADAAVRADIEAIEDPERRAKVRAAWDDATSSMSFAIGGPAMLRRAIADELKIQKPSWKAMFDAGNPFGEMMDSVRNSILDAVMAKIEPNVTSDAARGKLPGLRSEMQEIFDAQALKRYGDWELNREKVEARRRTSEARKAFQDALRTRGIAVAKLNKLDEWLNGTALDTEAKEKNPVSALMDEHMRADVPDFVAKMGALGVTADVAQPLSEAIAETRFMTSAPVRLLDTILNNADMPQMLQKNLPVGEIVKAFMAAPAHQRHSAAWRNLQITNWLENQGIDDALAARLAVGMDQAVAAVMGNVIFQEQERFLKRQAGIGTQSEDAAKFAKFLAKFRNDRDAIRKAIRNGLLTDGTPWQAWFSEITGVKPLTKAETAQIAAYESIISGDLYYPSEKGKAAAGLRDLMDEKFGKDAGGWQLLAASYTQSALTGGTTAGVQVTGPLGKLLGTLTTDMLARPLQAVDIAESFLDAVEVYEAEIQVAWKYDTGGSYSSDVKDGLLRTSPLKRDMAKQRDIFKNPDVPRRARLMARLRFVRSAQDYMRQAYSAADTAALQGFARYFQSRELRSMMRASNITLAEVRAYNNALSITTDNISAQADMLGYTGAMKTRYVQDAMQREWMEAMRAHAATPEEHKARMATLLKDSEAEAEFQAFIGQERDSMRKLDFDTVLGGVQWVGERAFQGSNKLMDQGYLFSGALLNIGLRSTFGFVGVPLNATRAMLWYTPLSIPNWIYHHAYQRRRRLGKLHTDNEGNVEKNPYERSLGNALQVRQRTREFILGQAVFTLGALMLMARDDDDEDEWVVNGYGPDPAKFPQETQAWRRLHTPLSIERRREDGKSDVILFTRGGLEWMKGTLSLLGGANDARLNSQFAGETSPEKSAMAGRAFMQLGMSSITSGMRNLAGFRDVLQRGTTGQEVGSRAGFMASPVLPWSGAARWVSTWIRPERLEKGFVNNLPAAPIWSGGRPALNLYGDPLHPTPEGSELFSRQTSGALPIFTREPSPDDRALYGWTERSGKFPTSYSRSEVDKKIGRTLTDDEHYKYAETSGKYRKAEMLKALAGTRDIQETLKLPGNLKDIKRSRLMKKSLLDIDVKDAEAMKDVQSKILTPIGQEAHEVGLAAIAVKPPEKPKAVKRTKALAF